MTMWFKPKPRPYRRNGTAAVVAESARLREQLERTTGRLLAFSEVLRKEVDRLVTDIGNDREDGHDERR